MTPTVSLAADASAGPGAAVYVSLGKAAKRLGVTPATVRRWTTSGFLPCTRTAGGHRRIATEDIEDLARAIGDRSHLEARRARERELETLVRASIDVAGRLDQAELLESIARQLTRLLRCDTCEILEYDAEADAVRVLAEYDAGGHRRPTAGVFPLREFPLTRRVLDEQAAVCVNADDRGADPAEVAMMLRYGEKSVLMLPLVVQGGAIGLVEVCDRRRRRAYSPQELRLGGALAGHAAVALRNAQLFGAAHDADAAVDDLRRRVGVLAARLADKSGLAYLATGAPVFAEALRDAFEARSCVVAMDGKVLGAAAAPLPAEADAGPGENACVLTAAAGPGDRRVEVTLALQRPALAGEAEILRLAAAVVAGMSAE